MLSWIFRNRIRLRMIYGAPAAPPLPGARFAGQAPAQLSAELFRGGATARPGQLFRTSRHVLVRPMPRRVA